MTTTFPYSTINPAGSAAILSSAGRPTGVYLADDSQSSTSSFKVSSGMVVNGKLTVDGIDVAASINAINARLAILVPNPEHLEKYEALRNAYESYKTLEALILNEQPK